MKPRDRPSRQVQQLNPRTEASKLATLAVIINLSLALAIAYSSIANTLIPIAGQAPVLAAQRMHRDLPELNRPIASNTATAAFMTDQPRIGDVPKDIVTGSVVFVSIYTIQARR